MATPTVKPPTKNGARWFQIAPEPRDWEDLYRQRWACDKVVRTSHGVNCSMSCSWMVHVKDGIITWELQANDWPQIRSDTPNHEPRGCQRGIASSWYVYSPARPKYPYVRGVLWDFYREARAEGRDAVEAWGSIVEDPEKSRRYKSARGKGGWRRASWDDITELVAGAMIYTVKKYGPDRLASFTPIPAMSMLSFTSGTRFMSLLGGAVSSFYDWYCDLPPASPMIWGEQTDVHESADWYQSTYWIVAGTNLPMTRTADAHYMSEFKYNGGKVVVFSPDFSDHTKFADAWVPLRPGTDGAFALAMNHVIIKEFCVDRQVPYFQDYQKRYTSLPFLVVLEKNGERYLPGRILRASDVENYAGEENAEWKPVVCAVGTGDLKLPQGSMGFRWEKNQTGRWNLEMKDAATGEEIDPALTMLGRHDQEVQVSFADFDNTFTVGVTGREPGAPTEFARGVPAKRVRGTGGAELLVTTVFDILAAQMGVSRGLGGDYPQDYDDPKGYTPAWQESITGVGREMAVTIAREFAENAEKTQGKSLLIMGPGVNHWYHADLSYRAMINLVILTGCVGRNGGGWCHYVGTEKLRNQAAIATLSQSLDWYRPPRTVNSTSNWYFQTGQWRYDAMDLAPQLAPWADKLRGFRHAADMNALAVRLGWLPSCPTLNKNPLTVVEEARASGASTDEEIIAYAVEQLKEGKLKFAIEDVDAPENSLKCLVVWRGNLIGSSMKGHEYALKHMLGTHNNVLGEEQAQGKVKEIEWREDSPIGRLDLLVNVDFRMASSANYADVVLPAAHWYEKHDLTVSDLHTFIHPFQPATNPPWETKPDWETFGILSEKISLLAKKHFPTPVKDLVIVPMMHDSPQEMAQPYGEIKDWKHGEVEPMPGKTMPAMVVVERDFAKHHEMYTTFGPLVTTKGYGAKGVMFDLGEIYEKLKQNHLIGEKNGRPSIETDRQLAEVVLQISPETNGETAYKAWKSLEPRVGLRLADLVEHRRDENITFADVVAKPQRVLTSPMWWGIEAPGRTYAPYTVNIERLVPFRTLTGRQEVYLDHQVYRELGEQLPMWKPPVDTAAVGEVSFEKLEPNSKVFRYLTPHGKWSIHSTFFDNLNMLRLFRGGQTIWLNPDDAAEIGVRDNDWLEAYNENGIVVARATVSHRIPRETAFMYHASERHVNVPFSKLAQEKGKSDKRGGTNNALTRIMLNPTGMVGGYAQCSYFINYFGTVGCQRDTSVAIRKLPLEPGEGVQYR
ncbi:MAG: nitrate reductase subunit alpha [Chloroflexi bacterium]|nr:nitrate reductase subunit alpha [Chloroflexota bacterium]